MHTMSRETAMTLRACISIFSNISILPHAASAGASAARRISTAKAAAAGRKVAFDSLWQRSVRPETGQAGFQGGAGLLRLAVSANERRTFDDHGVGRQDPAEKGISRDFPHGWNPIRGSSARGPNVRWCSLRSTTGYWLKSLRDCRAVTRTRVTSAPGCRPCRRGCCR